jgi:hypothetical protein
MTTSKKLAGVIARSLDFRTRMIIREGIWILRITHLQGKELMSTLIKEREFFRYLYKKKTGREFQGNLFGHFMDISGI